MTGLLSHLLDMVLVVGLLLVLVGDISTSLQEIELEDNFRQY